MKAERKGGGGETGSTATIRGRAYFVRVCSILRSLRIMSSVFCPTFFFCLPLGNGPWALCTS